MLRIFWELLKPEEQFTEDPHDRLVQAKIIKQVPAVQNYPFKLRRLHCLPAKVVLGVEMVCPARNLPSS